MLPSFLRSVSFSFFSTPVDWLLAASTGSSLPVL